jgi:micrococcal nuclease
MSPFTPAVATTGTRAAAANAPAGSPEPGSPPSDVAPRAEAAAGHDTCAAQVPGAIEAATAKDYLDTFQAVAFRVADTKDTGRVTFLNSRSPYQGHFYVAIFPTLYDQFPAPPAVYFKGKCVVVQGEVALYRGTPQIVVQTVDDIRVVDSG